ncbi:MAG: hypothetical protein RLZZ571_706 [Actinomycetota bacterium]
MEDILTGLQVAMTVVAGTFLLDGIESLSIGNIRLTDTGIMSADPSQDITIGNPGDTGYLSVSNGIKFPDGTTQQTATLIGPRGATGAVGPQGVQGPQGAAGGFGYYGNFYDTATHVLTANTATPIPLDTTVFQNGISIVDNYKITFSNPGKYNLAFSSQLWNQNNQRRYVTIWLSKNGVTSDKWIAETGTDLVIGTSLDNERIVAAWNFFLDASANDYFVLMVAVNGSQVSLQGGSSLITNPAGIPSIPSTILTVNQVG